MAAPKSTQHIKFCMIDRLCNTFNTLSLLNPFAIEPNAAFWTHRDVFGIQSDGVNGFLIESDSEVSQDGN